MARNPLQNHGDADEQQRVTASQNDLDMDVVNHLLGTNKPRTKAAQAENTLFLVIAIRYPPNVFVS
jgi:hypothetical protein